MVREIGFEHDDRIEVSKLTLFMFLVGALLLMVLCALGAKGAYDIAVNHIAITNKNQVLWFLCPIVFCLALYIFILSADCLLTKPYIIVLSPAGIDLTWPKARSIAWGDIRDIRVDITTSKGVDFVHLVIDLHTDKTGWVQRYFKPNQIKLFSPLMKGGADAAYEKVVAAQQRYAIKTP